MVQLGQIGDYVLSIPLLLALKESYGKRLRLSIIVDSINEKISKNDEYVDDIIIYNSRKYAKLDKLRTLEFSPLNLYGKKFDLAIWLRGDLHVLKWILKNRVPLKCIKKSPNPLRWSWLPLITKKTIKKKFNHFIESLDHIDNDIKKPSSFALPKMLTQKQNFNSDGCKNVFIHIASGNKLRRWPEEKFSELFKLLLDENDRILINIVGGMEDFEMGERTKKHTELAMYRNRIRNLCGTVALTELKQLFADGALYVGCDSGPMHVAASSGIPIVAMMGPQSPQLFGPWGNQEIRIVYKEYYCSPCWQFSCLHTKNGAGACILAIKPHEVFSEAQHILSKRRM